MRLGVDPVAELINLEALDKGQDRHVGEAERIADQPLRLGQGLFH